MDYKAFYKDIEDGLSGAYLLAGAEEYAKDAALREALSSIEGAARDMNISVFAEVTPADRVIEACEQLPCFCDRRIVVLKYLPTGDDASKLAKYAKDMPKTTALLIAVRGTPPSTGVIMKNLSAMGRYVEFKQVGESAAVKWIVKQSKKLGGTIADDDAAFLVRRKGTELSVLSADIRLLCDYAGEGETVTRDMIILLIQPNLESRTRDMMDAYFAGRTKDALRSLSILMDNKESGVGICSYAIAMASRAAAARRLLDKGLSSSTATAKLGGDWRARQAVTNAAGNSHAKLLSLEKSLFDAISGAMSDKTARESITLALIKPLEADAE